MSEALIRSLEMRVASMERQIERLMRRNQAQFALARSTAPAVDGGAVQTNQGKIDALSLRDGMPTLYSYGFSSSLPIGGDKMVAFLNGDRSQGVVIATGHQAHRFTGLQPGESVLHDQWGHFIHMTEAGIIINGGGNQVTITNTPKVRAETALFEVTGDIQDNCDTQSETMAGQRTVYNSHTHNVENVQSGGVTRVSDVPNQLEI